jgi:hypothetical protein
MMKRTFLAIGYAKGAQVDFSFWTGAFENKLL